MIELKSISNKKKINQIFKSSKNSEFKEYIKTVTITKLG